MQAWWKGQHHPVLRARQGLPSAAQVGGRGLVCLMLRIPTQALAHTPSRRRKDHGNTGGSTNEGTYSGDAVSGLPEEESGPMDGWTAALVVSWKGFRQPGKPGWSVTRQQRSCGVSNANGWVVYTRLHALEMWEMRGGHGNVEP